MQQTFYFGFCNPSMTPGHLLALALDHLQHLGLGLASRHPIHWLNQV